MKVLDVRLFLGALTVVFIVSCKPKAQVSAWQLDQSPVVFPEESLNLPSTGVCFSGGGTRALSCAAGQMKGLHELGLWEDVGYVSCVSGGSWASTIFTYCDSTISDKELLGEIRAPGDLDMKFLGRMSEKFLGYSATRSLEEILLEKIIVERLSSGALDPADRIWIDAVGHTYLEPYGIYDPLKPRYFTLDIKTMRQIVKANPYLKLSAKDFYRVHDADGDVKRPFLVINSCLMAPASTLPLDTANRAVVFNYTPLYVGTAHGMEVKYVSRVKGASEKARIGGVFLQPVGFSGEAPDSWSPAGIQQLKLGHKKFRLADATGTSSSAYAATVAVSAMWEQVSSKVLLGFQLDQMMPEEPYWTVNRNTIIPEQNYRFGDGGNLENYGLLTLLQRGLGKIVVFVNSASPIVDACFDSVPNPTDYASIDPDLPPLFGYKGGILTPNQANNTVFKQEDFKKLYTLLYEAKMAGKPVMANMTMETVQNDWWGIKGGNSVEILWVYNEQVDDWQDQLPKKVQDEIAKGNSGDFPNFPFYKTMFEDGIRLVQYTPEQVNLLYQLSAWNVYTNAEMFEFLKED